MEKFILTTPEELGNLIQQNVRIAFNEQSPKEEQNKIFTIQEASVFLNLARQTLYGFTSKNEIPYIKRGKKLYFRKSDLERWFLEGKRKSNTEILKEIESTGNKTKK